MKNVQKMLCALILGLAIVGNLNAMQPSSTKVHIAKDLDNLAIFNYFRTHDTMIDHALTREEIKNGYTLERDDDKVYDKFISLSKNYPFNEKNNLNNNHPALDNFIKLAHKIEPHRWGTQLYAAGLAGLSVAALYTPGAALYTGIKKLIQDVIKKLVQEGTSLKNIAALLFALPLILSTSLLIYPHNAKARAIMASLSFIVIIGLNMYTNGFMDNNS